MAPINDYLALVHQHTPASAVIGLSSITGTQVYTQWFQRQHIAKLIEAAIAIDKRANVYIRITPLAKPPERGRGLEKHSIGSSCLWVDYDSYANPIEGLQALQALPKPPSLIVNSGNGLHAYWLLKNFETDLDAIKARNLGLIIALNDGKKDGIADSCYDLARILRLPGTYNVKHAKPLLCTIIDLHPERVYTLEDFTPAEYTETAITVWDSAPLAGDFIDAVKERDHKLYKRIFSEATAKKVDASTKSDGSIDRSRNDAYIATRLLGLGYAPETILSVLMQEDWLSGAKYTQTKRYDYVVMTVNAAVRIFEQSEDRYFIKTSFQTDKLAGELNTSNKFIYVAEKLWRYDGGVYLDDGEQFVKAQAVQRLGKRWSSRASDETVRYITDQAHVPQESVNAVTEFANVQNGMLHLPTLTLQPHSPSYLSLSQVPIMWQPDVNTDKIDTFISQVLIADAIPVFWEFVGSAFITARYDPKAFVVLWGEGDSGKSKVIELLGRFFGRRNMKAVPFQTLADNKFATAGLYGKMINLFSDLSQTEANNGDFVKTLTGDDVLTSERKFKDGFEFKPTARLMFSANHFPKVKSPDEPYFKRAVIIHCPNHFDKSTADPDIVNKLATPKNFQAILLNAVRGYQRLIANNGFSEAASITTTRNEYRMSADTVAGFWGSCDFDLDAVVEKDIAYQIYRQVCQAANRPEVSDDLFYKRTAANLARFGMHDSYDVVAPATRDTEQVRKWRYHGRRVPQNAIYTVALKTSNASNRN